MNNQIQQRIDRLKSYGQSLAGANVAYREDWGTIYFGLIGKQLGMMSPEANDDAIITLKNKPEVNEELREQYPEAIIPGYYANKTHWNSESDLRKLSEICWRFFILERYFACLSQPDKSRYSPEKLDVRRFVCVVGCLLPSHLNDSQQHSCA